MSWEIEKWYKNRGGRVVGWLGLGWLGGWGSRSKAKEVALELSRD